MRKYISIFVLIFTLLGCEEGFDPKLELQNKYVMTSIIGSYNNPQFTQGRRIIRLTKLYDVEGFNPEINTEDPSVKGAIVDFYHNNQKYGAEEVTQRRADTSRYKGDEVVYKSPVLDIRPADLIKVNCQTPDGTLLKGETRLPSSQTFEYSYPFNRGITTNINRFLWGNSWVISWRKSEGILYFPRLQLNYRVETSDSTSETKTVIIPTKYIMTNGQEEAVVPNYSTESSIEYTFDAIDTIMARISAGDPNKGRYKILSIQFDFTEFDNNLSSYYSSTKGYLDQFSIRLDESIYSNVSSGAGIVGSFMNSTISFDVERSYVFSFGYK